jgi:hypothetical protein
MERLDHAGKHQIVLSQSTVHLVRDLRVREMLRIVRIPPPMRVVAAKCIHGYPQCGRRASRVQLKIYIVFTTR